MAREEETSAAGIKGEWYKSYRDHVIDDLRVIIYGQVKFLRDIKIRYMHCRHGDIGLHAYAILH